jgi:predicted NBD/HSP70 family sugar kinase
LARDYRRTTGESLEGAAIAERAERGEPAAEATLERYEHRMARALASVVNLLDPDVIVLGGGVSNLRRLYERVPALWHQFVFSDRVDTRLVPPRYGDASGVRGAAWLWDRSG